MFNFSSRETGEAALNRRREPKGEAMGIRASWRVDISCDGSSSDCPCNSTFSADLHVSASMRLADRAGWELADLTLCPSCSTADARTGAGPTGHPRRSHRSGQTFSQNAA